MGNYEEGKWRLNDPVSRYVPELAGLKVHVGQNADGSMQLEDAGHEMTMRELMTHTAGLGYVLNPRHPVNHRAHSRFPGTVEPLAKLLGSRLGSVLRFSGVKTPLSWISTACSGPEGPAASQETETKGIDVFSTERRDTGG